MNRRIILAMTATGLIGFCAISTAKADETLRLRWTAHTTAPVQSQEVGDVDGHFIGVFRYSGITLAPDGSAGTLYYTGTYDYIKGSSTDRMARPKDSNS